MTVVSLSPEMLCLDRLIVLSLISIFNGCHPTRKSLIGNLMPISQLMHLESRVVDMVTGRVNMAKPPILHELFRFCQQK